MTSFKLSQHLTGLVKLTMNHIEYQVKIEEYKSKVFYAETGLRQCNALSCMLFNLALKKGLRDTGAIIRMLSNAVLERWANT